MSELTEIEATQLRERWFKDGDSRYEVVTGKTEYYRIQCLSDLENDQITKLKSELQDAREVIGFYGDMSNWLKDESPHLLYQYGWIATCDLGPGEVDGVVRYDYGGRRAREFLAKYPNQEAKEE